LIIANVSFYLNQISIDPSGGNAFKLHLNDPQTGVAKEMTINFSRFASQGRQRCAPRATHQKAVLKVRSEQWERSRPKCLLPVGQLTPMVDDNRMPTLNPPEIVLCLFIFGHVANTGSGRRNHGYAIPLAQFCADDRALRARSYLASRAAQQKALEPLGIAVTQHQAQIEVGRAVGTCSQLAR
jgi:hypothetical protein